VIPWMQVRRLGCSGVVSLLRVEPWVVPATLTALVSLALLALRFVSALRWFGVLLDLSATESISGCRVFPWLGVPRLSIPSHQWLVETNSMIASSCYGNTCATSFPSALNLAASFNSSLWRAKGSVLGTEIRAFNNLAWFRADTQNNTHIGLSGFGPDINQVCVYVRFRVLVLVVKLPSVAGCWFSAATGPAERPHRRTVW
jgi:hypothetical protein